MTRLYRYVVNRNHWCPAKEQWVAAVVCRVRAYECCLSCDVPDEDLDVYGERTQRIIETENHPGLVAEVVIEVMADDTTRVNTSRLGRKKQSVGTGEVLTRAFNDLTGDHNGKSKR